MKKRLTKIALAASLLSMPAVVGANEYTSLFAVEGGYNKVSADVTESGQMFSVQDSKLGSAGLKLGAQGENFRVFLSARYYDAEDFSKLDTLGAEVEYLFHFSKPVSFFLSANAGKAFMKVGSKPYYASVSTNEYYYGGGAGFNVTVTDLIDVEVGARYIDLDSEVTQGTATYKFNSITSAYGSIIFKWQMD
ncbi:outer membrane beta-barrel protein [Sulfurimonas paralvinellae]|nr:outer membrane beta-barrel protein [Sulfurimonas paralvinellae]